MDRKISRIGRAQSNNNDVPLENLPDEELLLITTYEEMAARPRFKVEVDPKSIKPMKILGGYPRLPGLVKCGLSTCHKKHYKGYLILTDCGLETNIGHDCGRKYFGVEFTSMVSDFERDSRISNYRAQIQAVREIAQNLLAQADNARRREMGANWLWRQLEELRRVLPRDLYTQLKQRAIRGDVTVFEERELSTSELEIRRAMGSGRGPAEPKLPLFERVPVGSFIGLDVFTESIRDLLVNQIEKPLQSLPDVDLSSLTEKKLRNLAKEAGEIPLRLRRCDALLEAGRVFFSLSNHGLLGRLAKTDDERKAVRAARNLFTRPVAKAA